MQNDTNGLYLVEEWLIKIFDTYGAFGPTKLNGEGTWVIGDERVTNLHPPKEFLFDQNTIATQLVAALPQNNESHIYMSAERCVQLFLSGLVKKQGFSGAITQKNHLPTVYSTFSGPLIIFTINYGGYKYSAWVYKNAPPGLLEVRNDIHKIVTKIS